MRVELFTDVEDAGTTVYLLVRIEAETASPTTRTPVNLALVIDRSSSMRGPRITHAIEAARQVVSQLDARDRLSIIAFDASARTVFGPAAVTDQVKADLDTALPKLRTGVGTNLAAGIKKGAEAVRSGYVRGAIGRLVLLTDGQPSIGITDSARLCTLAEKEAGRGVTITTMGLGESFDDELLSELARSGRGGFHYLANPADIPGAFGRELAGVFAIAATKTEVSLRPAGHIATAELLHRLPSHPIDDGLVVEFGELATATPRQILFRLSRMPAFAAAPTAAVPRAIATESAGADESPEGPASPEGPETSEAAAVATRADHSVAADAAASARDQPTSAEDDDHPVRCGTLTVTFRNPDGSTGDAHLLGIELPVHIDPEHARAITLERIRLAVASAVDTAWARRASGDSTRALAALGEIKAQVIEFDRLGRADHEALSALLRDIAEAESAVVKSSAERERARRSMRERSHITLLGQSNVRRLPPGDEE